MVKKISETFSNHDLSWNHPESIHTFVLKSISPGKTKHNLSLLSIESSLDILEFDRKLLQISAPYINISLNYLFNESLNCGFLPNDWKLARTAPVYKGKGDKNNISNYRPISVVCHIAKLLENEVKSHFLSYLQTNHLISVD